MADLISTIGSFTQGVWVITSLLPLLVFLILELFRSLTLSQTETIKKFVDTIDHKKINGFIVTSADIKVLKEEFEKKGIQYFSLSIRQAVGFAVAHKKAEISKVEVDIEYIDRLTGLQFEKLLCDIFKEKGYKAIMTKASGDQGVDLIIYNGERKIAVQCKRYKESYKVGNTAIQEVITGKLFYDCTEAWVISTSTYTSNAIKLASKVGVKLIDRNGLIALIKGSGYIL
ncbi:restriction endonuclease [Sporosarcina sp. FSL K6-5500]|uniref:restriction endonuclease n=1 Tax=Sporosarcina sp. FSL K6-5500 TaxID=2921558 RepID=UPI0030F80A51